MQRGLTPLGETCPISVNPLSLNKCSFSNSQSLPAWIKNCVLSTGQNRFKSHVLTKVLTIELIKTFFAIKFEAIIEIITALVK